MVGNKNRLPAPYQKDWDNLFFGYALLKLVVPKIQQLQVLKILIQTHYGIGVRHINEFMSFIQLGNAIID